MTRRMRFVKATIVCDGPAGVAAPEAQALPDPDQRGEIPVPLAAGPRGPWVPGTSIAGSLRAHLGGDADRVMGSPPPPPGDGNDEAELTPSALRILGSCVTVPAGSPVEVRRSTAVDRHRAAARPMTLRPVERLPAGSTVAVWMRLDDDHMWPILSKALATWRPVIGGGLTRGFGRAHLAGLRHGLLDLDRPEHLAWWLRLGGPELADRVISDDLKVSSSEEPSITVRWLVTDALHVGNGEFSDSTPQVAMTTRTMDGHVVPGSTWKGVLRGRAEYILASCGQPVCFSATCGSCVACTLFGYAEDSGEQDGVSQRGGGGQRGMLAFGESRVGGPGGSSVPPSPVNRTHVAIDRITGGSRDKLLYTDEVLEEGELTLTIRFLEEIPPWGRGLLWLAVRDIHDGYAGIGGGTTRGQGTLRLADPGDLAALDGADGDAVRTMLAGGGRP